MEENRLQTPVRGFFGSIKGHLTGPGFLGRGLTRFIIYYEQQKNRDLKGIHICGCRCNERLKTKTDGSTRPGYIGLRGELEHLKIETRLTGESFECVMVRSPDQLIIMNR